MHTFWCLINDHVKPHVSNNKEMVIIHGSASMLQHYSSKRGPTKFPLKGTEHRKPFDTKIKVRRYVGCLKNQKMEKSGF